VTKREQVERILSHRGVQPVPYYLDFTPPVEAWLCGHFGIDPHAPEAKDALNRALGNAMLRMSVMPEPMPQPDAGARQPDAGARDAFGVVWAQTDVNRGAPVSHPLPEPSLRGYRFPEPPVPALLERMAKRIEENRDLYVALFVGDLFERACFLRGMEAFLLDLVSEPAFARELLQRLMDYTLAAMEPVAKLPVDCVFLSDDYGDQRGLLLSPVTWRELVAPQLARFCARARELGLTPALHSCGNIRVLLPELIDLSFAIIHPVQPEAMDVVEVKRTLGGRFTIYGGLETQRVLPDGSPEEVRALIARRIRELSPGGGFILGPAMKLQHDVPPENLLALIDACQNQAAVMRDQ
jgi:uroporphyrinogen decarboxylase